MRPRLHVPGLDPSLSEVELPSDEAAHLVRVLRLGAGAGIDIFDGRGGLWRATVARVSRHGATVHVHEAIAPAPETLSRVRLVASVLKGDKMDDVVRDAVMLGAHAIVPIISARTETSAAVLARGQRPSRWRRIAVASAKQCGRAVVPDVAEPVALERYLSEVCAGARLLCVEPSAAPADARPLGDVPMQVAADIMVGPEGGWTPDEVEAACRAGAIPVILGRRILRADAMPLVALTALLTVWRDL